MIYGLVIVTSLGATTLLNTFPDRMDCIREQAFITKSPHSSAQCWPGSSQDEIEKRVQQINSAISSTIKK